MSKWIGESALSFLFIAVGVVFWVAASPLKEAGEESFFGPADFPRILSVILALLGGLNFLRVLSRRAKNGDRLSFSATAAAGAALCALYTYLIPIAGYFYVTPFFGICLMLLLGYRKPLQIFLVSAGFTLAAYLVFYRLLSVALPV